MGTRCIVVLKDNDDVNLVVYGHWDGYPSGEYGVLAELELALPLAWEFPRFEADEFGAALVAAWKRQPGNVRLFGDFKGWEYTPGDIEWVYIIDGSGSEEPIVTVYAWHPACGEGYAPFPEPAWTGKFSEAKVAGLNWQNGK